MQWQPLGDRAWLWQSRQPDDARRLAESLSLARQIRWENLASATDVVSSFDTVAVHTSPGEHASLGRVLMALPEQEDNGGTSIPRRHDVPVRYEIPDEVSGSLGLSPDEIIRLHSEARYTVAALGFSPGFPYLTGLPEPLHLPRLTSPRPVPAGAVAMAGGQAGIYPNASQGGWHVLGRTAADLFRPADIEPTLLGPGDEVRFVPVDDPQDARPAISECASSGPVEILAPGLSTTIQDSGRPGWQHLGISPGGFADFRLARAANLVVGNPENAALLETSLQGPRIRFHAPVTLAFLGWDDPRAGRPVAFQAGEEIDFRHFRPTARHGVIAFAGGIDVPEILGSRATDRRAGFGGWNGRILKQGDCLALLPPNRIPGAGDWLFAEPISSKRLTIRVLAGVQSDWFSVEVHRRFLSEPFRISTSFDRTGVRLGGPALPPAPGSLRSQPVVAGSIQVPPGGQPIILMSERQTIGGYPQIGNVISADLPRLARALPGCEVRFVPVDLPAARAAWAQKERDWAFLRTALALKLRPES